LKGLGHCCGAHTGASPRGYTVEKKTTIKPIPGQSLGRLVES
jgi:hypothetical protein